MPFQLNWNRDTHRTFLNFKFKLKKKGVTSGASRLSYTFSRKLPLNMLYKKLWTTQHNNSGRIQTGRIGIFTKSAWKVKNRIPKINYNFRFKFISFIGNILILPFTHKIISMLFMSTGSITYIPTSHYHKLFTLIRMYHPNTNFYKYTRKIRLLNLKIFIYQGFFLIKHLKRNQPISLLEILPGDGVKYVRSPSTFAIATKTNYKLNTMLIKMPSGVRKVFSLFSIGSPGPNPLNGTKYWKSNKAGYYRRFGRKPIVRGVAKNPIDHPHGGRTKTLSYPRTPWGHTTKFK